MIYCDICWTEFNKDCHKEKHMNTPNHMLAESFQKKLKLNSEIVDLSFKNYCEICSIQTDTQAILKRHLNSKAHQIKLITKEKITKMNNDNDKSSAFETSSMSLYKKPKLTFSSTYDFKTVQQDCNPIKSMPHSFSTQNISDLNKDENDNNICELYCKLCDVTSNSKISYYAHMNSRKHKSKSNRYSDNQSLSASIPSSSSELSSSEIEEYYKLSNWCHCCYIMYSSSQHKEQHLSGMLHKKRFEMKEILFKRNDVNKDNYCTVCFCIVDASEQKNVHYSSKSHSSQFQRYQEYLKVCAKMPSSESSDSIKSISTSDDGSSQITNSTYYLNETNDFFVKNQVDCFKYDIETKNNQDEEEEQDNLNNFFVQINVKPNSAMEKTKVKIFKYANQPDFSRNTQFNVNNNETDEIFTNLINGLDNIYNKLITANELN